MTIDPLFNMHKIRFTKLDELISNNCSDITNKSNINVFINFETILSTLTKGDIEKYFRMTRNNKVFEFISNILNLASHYRLYFSKNKLFSKIFIYIGYPFDSVFKNKSINPNYRCTYNHKYGAGMTNFSTHDVVSESIDQSKTIFEYIDNVYLIASGIVEPALIPTIVNDDQDNKAINFLVTKDPYEYQYVNKGYYILRPKSDKSYLVSKNNVIDIMKQENNIVSDIMVDTEYLPFILSLLGDKKRNIEKVRGIGFGRLIKLIQLNLDMNILSPNVFNINLLSDVLKPEIRDILLKNYYCTDVDTQMKLLNFRDKHIILDQLKDKFDNDGLKKMNEMYFRENPINLIELTSGDKYLKKEKVDIFKVRS